MSDFIELKIILGVFGFLASGPSSGGGLLYLNTQDKRHGKTRGAAKPKFLQKEKRREFAPRDRRGKTSVFLGHLNMPGGDSAPTGRMFL